MDAYVYTCTIVPLKLPAAIVMLSYVTVRSDMGSIRLEM